jgi:succinoglycan biosynthesis transport protein ExoP
MYAEKRNQRTRQASHSAGNFQTILRRRWRWFACAFGICATVGGIFAFSHQPQYVAKATIRLLADKPITVFSDVHPTADDAVVRAQYYVLRSPRIMTPVVEKLNLESRWSTDEQGAVDRLRDSVSTHRLADANIVELRASDSDPKLAADIANAVVDAYSREANQPRYEQAKSMLQSLRDECDEQSKRIDQGEENIQHLRRAVGLSLGQSAVASAADNPFRESIAQADAQAIESQIRIESLQRMDKEPLVALQSSGDPVAQNLAMKLSDAQSTLSMLEHRYGEKHPRVIAARENLILLTADANDHINQTIEKLQADVDSAQARATRIRQQLQTDNPEHGAAGQYAELLAATGRQDVQRNLERILSERAEKLAVDLQMPTPAAEIIEPASAPVFAELSPAQLFLTALVIGIAAGIFFCVVAERWDNSVRGCDELACEIGLPILGTIGTNASMLRAEKGGKDVEAYRMIRNSIDFVDHDARAICVSGAGMNEGVTTTVANLAWAWGEQGARVLVIDCDLHNPAAHAKLSISNEIGLIDWLETGRSLDELVKPASQANVSVLAAGSGKESIALPMTPQKMSELLTWAKSRADIVLFDTGSILESSNSAIVAHHCDACVLVSRKSHTKMRNLRRGVHVLKTTGTRLLGAILTAAPAEAWDPQQSFFAISQQEEAAAVNPTKTRVAA